MNINHITFKILKVNFRRYLLFLLCCSYSIMVFFIFATVYTNSSFMNNFQTSSIASNIIAPSISVAIFSIFFMIYAYSSFLKYRKSEFGLFMILGMTNSDALKMMRLEISIIAGISMLLGLLSGTLCSPLFYYLVIKLTNIKGIHFSLTLNSYLYSIVFFIVVYIFMLMYSVITIRKNELIDLLKQVRIKDNDFLSHPVGGIIGIVIIGFSFFDMSFNFKSDNSFVLLRSFFASIIGLYLCISNIIFFLSIPLKLSRKLKYRYMLCITDLKYTLGQTKKVLFIMSLLASITIVFVSISVIIMLQSQRIAIAYNPYDIAYVKSNNINNISDNTLDDIIKKGGDTVISNRTLEIINMGNFVYLSDKNINVTLGYKLPVEKGHFISLYQVVSDDGYENKLDEFSNINIPIGNTWVKVANQSNTTQVLFNRLNKLEYSNIFILNDSDYLDIRSSCMPDNIGEIKLMNFQDWKNTNKINDDINAALTQYNKQQSKTPEQYNSDMEYLYQTASKIGDYNTQMQSASFLLFLSSFVAMLFFVSSEILVHFKLLTEFEKEKIKYRKLNKIGIKSQEVARIISCELFVLFFVPIMLSILLATFYCYNLAINAGEGSLSALYSIIIGLIYLVVQSLYYFIYKRFYIRKILSAI